MAYLEEQIIVTKTYDLSLSETELKSIVDALAATPTEPHGNDKGSAYRLYMYLSKELEELKGF